MARPLTFAHVENTINPLFSAKSCFATRSSSYRSLSRRLLSIHKRTASTAPVLAKEPAKDTLLSPEELSIYPIALPPNASELQYAAKYFSAPARMLAPFHRFRDFPRSEVPEVTVLGRSNVGKSSLLNALLGSRGGNIVAAVSKKPGRTRSMDAIGLNGAEFSHKQKLWFGKQATVLVDMPGYGYGSREDWGTEIIKYLSKREQYVVCNGYSNIANEVIRLCRSFLLIDSFAGVQSGDREILKILTEHNLKFDLILSKVDKIVGTNKPLQADEMASLRSRLREIQEEVASLQNEQRGGRFYSPNILGCSTHSNFTCGIDNIRWAILESTKDWNTRNGRKLLAPESK